METLNPIREALAHCQEYLALETHDYKLLEGDKLNTVLSLYGLEGFKSEVYYNGFVFIFTSLEDYENLKFYISKAKTVFKIELPQYEKYLIALEYYNDSALPQVLT